MLSLDERSGFWDVLWNRFETSKFEINLNRILVCSRRLHSKARHHFSHWFRKRRTLLHGPASLHIDLANLDAAKLSFYLLRLVSKGRRLNAVSM